MAKNPKETMASMKPNNFLFYHISSAPKGSGCPVPDCSILISYHKGHWRNGRSQTDLAIRVRDSIVDLPFISYGILAIYLYDLQLSSWK